MKSTWILNLAAGIMFLVAAVLYLIDKEYLTAVLFSIVGLLFIISSRLNYNRTKTSKTYSPENDRKTE